MITRLKVRNFRSLKEFDLELGPVNLLVGPNMAGKSNVVDVFRFLIDLLQPIGAQQGLWAALNPRGSPVDLPWKGSAANFINIGIEGDRDDEPGVHWTYGLAISFPPIGFVQIQKETLTLRRGSEERELIGERRSGAGGPWLKNYDGRELVTLAGADRSALQSRIGNWDGDFLAPLIQNWRFHQFIPALMKAPNQTGAGSALEKNGANISAWLMWIQTQHPDQFARINQAACDLLPGFRKLLTSPTQQGMVFISSQESGLKSPVHLSHMSDGELVVLALLSLIYSPPEWDGSLYCIEEPESHLYPKLLGALIRLLRQVREEAHKAGRPVPQLIITTQSPQLVDLFSLDEVIWLQKKDGATIAIRPSDKQHLHHLVNDKELGLADVVYSGMLSAPE